MLLLGALLAAHRRRVVAAAEGTFALRSVLLALLAETNGLRAQLLLRTVLMLLVHGHERARLLSGGR